jgi:hypothetical protein
MFEKWDKKKKEKLVQGDHTWESYKFSLQANSTVLPRKQLTSTIRNFKHLMSFVDEFE